MSSTLATAAYVGATILFILSLGGLSNPESSRRGNLYGMVGMTIAVLATVALVGYDGGRVAAERLADHVVVTRSENIPRIQEAQASAYHVLRELVA